MLIIDEMRKTYGLTIPIAGHVLMMMVGIIAMMINEMHLIGSQCIGAGIAVGDIEVKPVDDEGVEVGGKKLEEGERGDLIHHSFTFLAATEAKRETLEATERTRTTEAKERIEELKQELSGIKIALEEERKGRVEAEKQLAGREPGQLKTDKSKTK